jgi:hypothetical protein
VAFGLYLLGFHRARFRRVWPGLLVSVVVGLLLAAPLLHLLYQNPGMEQRVGQLTDAWGALKAGDPGPVLSLSFQALGMLLWQGEKDWLYNVYGRPVLDPLAAICFLLGVCVCLWRWRQPRCALLLFWFGVGISPAAVVPPAASLTHAIAAQSPAYVLVALGVESLVREMRSRARGRWRWVGPLLAAGLVAVHGILSGRAYFVVWANAPEVRELYQGSIGAVARELDARDPPGPVAVGAPYINYWHPWNAVAFDLTLRRDDLAVRWFNPAGGWVWPAGVGPTTYYFPTDPLGPQGLDPALEELFGADAVLLPRATGEWIAYQVLHPVAVESRLNSLAQAPVTWPPELAHLGSPRLPLVFGDRFALLGVEPQGDRSFPGDTVRLVTYWEVLDADPNSTVAFVHLTSDGRDIWGQQDWLDVRTESLLPGDRFAQVHSVPVAPEARSGVYHVQLGLYSPDTLLRLPIAAGDRTTADRVWVARIDVGE